MATASQIKALIKSHFEGDGDRFKTVALQLAAHEARLGHGAMAQEIKKLIDKGNEAKAKIFPLRKELDELVIQTSPSDRLSELVLPGQLKQRIERILREFRQRGKLLKYGHKNRRKILLVGPPGTGKTLTSAVIASELDLPLFTILVDKLVTRYMGETSAKLRQIFDLIQERKGIYLFDEFDAIGGERSRDNDVGEMRRVLNAFLQFIEQDASESFIIAATNNADLLDQALFRRFDDLLLYHLPVQEEIIALINNRLGNFGGSFDVKQVASEIKGLSHAEITMACDDAIKEAILSDEQQVGRDLFLSMIKDRQQYLSYSK
ncbi:MAG: ATP-binding protein [Saprospiraceae bacterium]|nr:ATP-binding protein [Lewinella sp.]